MNTHILQSEKWAKFKKAYGTEVVQLDNIYYTKHKIPLTNSYYGYCPRIDPTVIDFQKVKKSLTEEGCITLHFDVPNIVQDTEGEKRAEKIFKKSGCVKSSRDEIAKGNFILDLSPSTDDLLKKMHHKQRYNTRLAERKGVKVMKANKNSFDVFYSLYKENAQRQAYFFRPRVYLKKLWDIFSPTGNAHILMVEYQKEPLAAWMLLSHEDILYYPYGGSSLKHRNFQASSLLGWEAIKLGKKLKLKTFDMWGAAVDMDNKKDPYHGFSVFKSRFGSKHVVYMDSYDFVINSSMYLLFTNANSLRWKLLNILKWS